MRRAKQWVADTRVPLPAASGTLAWNEDEDERTGTANLCMACEPLAGQRRVTVTDRRTGVDCAQVIRALVDGHSPQASTIVLA
jgi:hypothetical protein